MLAGEHPAVHVFMRVESFTDWPHSTPTRRRPPHPRTHPICCMGKREGKKKDGEKERRKTKQREKKKQTNVKRKKMFVV